MTPTEQARRSDALFFANVPRRELCDMVAHREADLDLERDARRYWQEMAESLMGKEGTDEVEGRQGQA